MRTRKALLILIALAMTVNIISGCATPSNNKSDLSLKEAGFNEKGFPIMKDKITVKVMGMSNSLISEWKDNDFFKRMEEKTNIKLDYVLANSQYWDEKKNIALASGDIPDVFFKAILSPSDEISYGDQGTFIYLEKLIESYAPNLNALLDNDRDIRKSITIPSGHIVTLPTLGDISGKSSTVNIYLNKKWLDKLGLKDPETIDDFYNVLVAFRDKDPNGNGKKDEIPLVLNGVEAINSIMHAWGLVSGENYMMAKDDGNVVFNPASPEYKEALKFLNKLFQEKLISTDSFTMTSQQLAAKGSQEDETLGCFYTSSPLLLVGLKRHGDYATMTPLKTKDGKQVFKNNSTIRRGTFAITNTCKYPEAMIRWADYLYSEEGSQLEWMGLVNQDFEMQTNGTWKWLLKPGESTKDKRSRSTIQPGGNIPGITPKLWVNTDDVNEQINIRERKKVAPFLKTPYPMVYFDTDIQKKVNSFSADIISYVDQMTAKFILGEISIDGAWDGYINKLNEMRLEEFIKIYQNAYDNYKKN